MTQDAAITALDLRLRRAFLWACALDVGTRKAGNVSLPSAGHGMAAQQFLDSAAASVGPLVARDRRVGERIEAAVQATWAVAQCNTNLGILLLCAPLIVAAQTAAIALPRGADLRVADLHAALGQVLEGLDRDDARAAYRAIARANPGGLGRAQDQDVGAEPQVGLREAMRLAAHRDLIARQYAEGFPEVFGPALQAFAAPLAAVSPRRDGESQQGVPLAQQAMLSCYLSVLSRHPDSHIVRKHGEASAQIVMTEARAWHDALGAGRSLQDDPAYAAWDSSLKARSLNPGTSADICVATAVLACFALPQAQAWASDDVNPRVATRG